MFEPRKHLVYINTAERGLVVLEGDVHMSSNGMLSERGHSKGNAMFMSNQYSLI